MVARISPQKRHDILLRAAAVLRPCLPDLHMLLVGEALDDTYLDSLQALASNLGLGDRISWVPFLPDIRIALVAADVLILPSSGEALGRCVIEAMAMEVPAIVSDSGGAQEVVRGRGLVVKYEDVPETARALKTVLTQPHSCLNFVASARRYVEDELTVSAMARAVGNLYRSICKRGESSAHLSG